jgi:hypothetical protein
MFGLTQVTSTTSYLRLIVLLVIMGFGMGAAMMPMFTNAVRTLSRAEVARGSTILNISQQIASSVGVAVLSVILTNNLKSSPLSLPAIASGRDPSITAKIGGPSAVREGLHTAGQAFAHTYWVAAVLMLLTLVPAWFLPRRAVRVPPAAREEAAAAAVMH